MKNTLVIDLDRCSGCDSCVAACKHENQMGLGVVRNHVSAVGPVGTFPDIEMYWLPMQCQQCENPGCIEVCPTQAMAKDEATGLVAVNTRKCIGCGYCHLACPYNAPQVDKSRGHSVKCEGCPDRLAAGEAPLCVLACPARALGFGTAEAMAARGERASTPPLPPAEETCPNLYIKPSRDSRAAGGGVAIGNVAETR